MAKLTDHDKGAITAEFKSLVFKYDSQNKAAKAVDISPASATQIINGNWDKINDSLWRQVMHNMGFSLGDWNIAGTNIFNQLTAFLDDSRENQNVFAITAEAGSGKSQCVKIYARNNKNVFPVYCADFWNRKLFLQHLLTSMGLDSAGRTVGDMMNEAIKYLSRAEDPLVVIDEADKLSDQNLYFFITLYNQLEGKCGIVLTATDHFEKRIKRGLNLNKKGYKEINSRMGGKCIKLSQVSEKDIYQVCIANGLDNPSTLKEIVSDSEGDLRRVKRLIHATLKKANRK